MDFELSKENILPLAGGRNAQQLGMALQAQTNKESQLELLQQKEQWEALIKSYTGDDPLDNYYKYICWIEQTYPKHGHEGNLIPLLEHCLNLFEKDHRYINDRRFCKLWIKYFDLLPNPLELYHMMRDKGLCSGCADFYKAWAYYHEAAGDFQSAKNVFEEGIKNLAQPYNELEHARQNLIMAAGQHLLYGANESQLIEKRQVLTSLHTYKPGRVSSVRVPSRNCIVTVPSNGSSSSAINAVVYVHEDRPGETTKGVAEAPPISIIATAKRQEMAKENTLKAGPWTGSVPVKKRVIGNASGSVAAGFIVHEDVVEPAQGIRMPKNYPKCSFEDYSDWHVAVSYPDPPNPAERPMYPKHHVYAELNTEYSIEEIRGRRYSQKVTHQPITVDDDEVEFVHEGTVEQNNDMLHRSINHQKPDVFPRAHQRPKLSPQETQKPFFYSPIGSAQFLQMPLTDDKSRMLKPKQCQGATSKQSPIQKQLVTHQTPLMLFQQSPMQTQHCPMQTHQSPIKTQQSQMHTQHSPMQTQESPMQTQQSTIQIHQTPMKTQQFQMRTQQSPMQTQQSAMQNQQPPIQTHPSSLQPQYLSPMQTQQPPIQIHQSSIQTQHLSPMQTQHEISPMQNRSLLQYQLSPMQNQQSAMQSQPINFNLWDSSPVSTPVRQCTGPIFGIFEQPLDQNQPRGSAMKTAFKVLNADELAETGSREGMDIAVTAQATDSAKPMPAFNNICPYQEGYDANKSEDELNTKIFNMNTNYVSTPQNKMAGLNKITPDKEQHISTKKLFSEQPSTKETKALSIIFEETKSSLGSSNSTTSSTPAVTKQLDTISEEHNNYLAQNLRANAELRSSLLGELMDFSTPQPLSLEDDGIKIPAYEISVREIPAPASIKPLDFVPSDPFKSQLINQLLERVAFPGPHTFGFIELPFIPRLCVKKEPMCIGKERYIMEKQLGKGTFGTVYKAIDLVNNMTVAMKLQKPANKWEYYICKELQSRLSKHPLKDRFMDIPLAYFGDQASLIISEYMPGGSLLDLANMHKQKLGKTMKECLVVYFCIEMLEIVQAMHEVKIIHADIKPDNFLVFVSPDNTVRLQLIDFGCSIDMSLFPPNASFRRRVTTEDFICCEMRDGRPWNYHTDLFCIAATAHVLLFDTYIKLNKKDDFWSIQQRFPRYLNVDLWDTFFSALLNQQNGPADAAFMISNFVQRLDSLNKDSSSALPGQMRYIVNLLKNR